ncbi:hypothetical protein UFOVP194_38 [uncultured Caudovirales phage]|uniref:LT_GEWL domain containing protein n=1 Tax=uncultured Caudovirales phage TaxID=2100421 RepID=A0A6J7WFQ1_9CAUD|nr:hypothetical protein UFOVP194_38 [uncultured Caudovirales phage]
MAAAQKKVTNLGVIPAVAVGKQDDSEPQEIDLNELASTLPPAQDTSPGTVEYDLSKLHQVVKPYKEPKKLGLLESMQGPYAKNEPLKLEKQFASLADTALNLPAAVASIGTYAAARPFTTPERAQELSGKVSSYLENPIGQATGITESPAYKGEGSRQLMDFIGQNIHKGASWVAEKAGIPVQDVENIANSLSFAAVPEAVKLGVKGVNKVTPIASRATQAIQDQFAARKGPQETVASEYLPNIPGESTAGPIHDLHPALAAIVTDAQKRGLPINAEALARQNEALSLGVDLTEGQRTQDPMLISKERNERGIKEQLVNKFNEQNQQLKNVAENFKAKVGPENAADNYVTNSEHILALTKDQIDANNKIAKEAYQKLDEASGGKLPIDGRAVGNNALEALKSADIEEYVPGTILSKLKSYAEGGKEMNFNLFENLRTQLANESRKAERAGDGNTVHALSVVRTELENLPLTNEAGGIKTLADEARSAFRANRQLEANNQFYGKAARGSLDSANLIQSTVFGVKNDYFGHVMDIVAKDPAAKQHLAQGTVDYMLSKSTDGSGNLNPMKMAKYIDDLDRNKRLEPLFGKDEAAQMRKYARVSRYTKSAPEGSFVNYSNTAPAAAQLIQQYGPAAAEVVGSQFGLPGGSQAASWVGEKMQQRATKKQAKKSTSPEAGIVGNKISESFNFGKD